jgi:TolB protein
MKRATMFRAGALAAIVAVAAAPVATSAPATPPGKNGLIAFTRYTDRDRTSGSIYVVQANGRGERRVTRAPAGARDTQADWSRDASLIVFERQHDGREWETYSVRPDGSRLTKLDPGCAGASSDICEASGPALSPDGKRIAFLHRYGGLGAIAVMNVDGSGFRQLTQLEKPVRSEDSQPFWSPDGKRIGFVRANSTASPRGFQAIFVMNADGTGVRPVTPWRLQAGDGPDWSPDGTWILFRSPQPGGFAGADLFRVRPDGTRLLRLTNTGPDVWMLSASFSPDGKSIVYASTGRGGLPDLYSMRQDGTGVRQITRTSAWDSAPDWGPR